MPVPSSSHVLVRHTSGLEKHVKRDRVDELSPAWSVVEPKRSSKRSAKPAGESTPPAVEPDQDSREG